MSAMKKSAGASSRIPRSFAGKLMESIISRVFNINLCELNFDQDDPEDDRFPDQT